MKKIERRRVLGRDLTSWCYLQFSNGATRDYVVRLLAHKIEDYYDRRRYWHQYGEPCPQPEMLRRGIQGIDSRLSEFQKAGKLIR